MRSTLYKCDRCGKSLGSKSAIKVNVNMQNGINPVEKKPFDFCKTCYMHVKFVFNNAMKLEAGEITEFIKSDDKPVSDTKLSEDKTVKIVSETVVKPSVMKSVSEKGAREAGFIMGPLEQKERDKILHMFVYDNLSADEIAEKINRLPRGVKRAINTAIKTGEIDKLRKEKAALEAEQIPKEQQFDLKNPSNDEYIPEQNSGSGASNAGVSKDSYTIDSRTEVIDGRRYDIGGVLALAKAGWTSDRIAEERHYDENVVQNIIKKYM